ncbi:hypothetical protein B0T20DRAFT_72248 [Sordaria brevicollis]|uniref:Uncharacterized protein n=1 Tax=Sordaria brevicollis TaxID=83679 RepID=A0AAE0P292_SORBR|nr:hypothetical protein B0T20DRAFT_72248 [Sordaria brevicollis]
MACGSIAVTSGHYPTRTRGHSKMISPEPRCAAGWPPGPLILARSGCNLILTPHLLLSGNSSRSTSTATRVTAGSNIQQPAASNKRGRNNQSKSCGHAQFITSARWVPLHISAPPCLQKQRLHTRFLLSSDKHRAGPVPVNRTLMEDDGNRIETGDHLCLNYLTSVHFATVVTVPFLVSMWMVSKEAARTWVLGTAFTLLEFLDASLTRTCLA